MKHVDIFTDGSCSGNPGPGGWAAILRYDGREKEICGGNASTTNNRMELTAVVEALKALKYGCEITLYTDSKYVGDGLSKGWAEKWRANGWRKADKTPALNPDLWSELLDESKKHKITVIWLRGHNGHPENERCDALAVEQTKRFGKQ